MYEQKLYQKELAEKIMSQEMTFYSRFLDISLEELCGYTKEQIEGMVNSTIEQMPEDLLRQFEIELAGRKSDL